MPAASCESEQGKRIHGNNALFPDIPNGIPGLAPRLPIVSGEGVTKGRIDLNEYVRLIATNPAKLFGLYPRKGTIAPGSGSCETSMLSLRGAERRSNLVRISCQCTCEIASLRSQ